MKPTFLLRVSKIHMNQLNFVARKRILSLCFSLLSLINLYHWELYFWQRNPKSCIYMYISGIMTSENIPHLQECNETFERVRSAFSCIASYLSKTSLPCMLRLIMLKYFLLHCWRCSLELWTIHTYVFWHLLLCGGGLCDYIH